MSATSWLLLAAQAGASLFQARASTLAAGQQAAATAGAAAFSGVLERFQIKEQASYEDYLRSRALATSMGAQRAASSAAGVVGGRTQQLLEARSQAAFTYERARARMQTSLELTSSEMQQRARIEGARIEASSAARQAQTSMFGDMLQIGTKAVDLFQTSKATTGPTS
jgi:hypothetical protein